MDSTSSPQVKSIFYLLVIAGLLVSLSPIPVSATIFAIGTQEALEELNEADGVEPMQVAPADTMYHFSMKVRWGNVIGEIQNKEEANFDGSIALSNVGAVDSTGSGRVTFVRDLLFEEHNAERDKITQMTPSVVWTSLIYNHWDGVKVLVSGKGSDTLTIETSQGSLSKTVKEFYDAREPIIQDVGEGREIVVKVFPIKKRIFNLEVLWGGPVSNSLNSEAIENKEGMDFSGNLWVEEGAALKFLKTVRFEPSHGDGLVKAGHERIYWNSYVFGGYDGIIAKVALKKNVKQENHIELSFTSDQVKWSNSYDIVELFHKKLIKETLTIGGQEYTVTLVVRRFTNRKLVKTANKSSVYMIEDEEARPILSEAVFEENDLDWNEIETISEDELEAYAEGEELNYPDGTLVKGSGGTVYVIADGQRRGFKTRQAFERLGYKFGNVRTIRDAELNKYSEDTAVTEESEPPEGALVREKGTAGVFVIKGGKQVPITSREVFESNGYQWGRILDLDNSIIRTRERAQETLHHPDGTLIQEEGKPGIYVIDKGEKKPIISMEDLKSRKFNLQKLQKVKAVELKRLKTGDEIIGE
ncbi:hypothetical protein KKD19_00195 [Patescibacteria group bacterium]|nr:hypothetical protein [Patescibacteria group bacterium]MBU4511653.1 hypothetical protein [Patescibacteria group bacterium]MCG2693291.1 hypothetical protein [Candidatus Parcubacteria bacterium]